MSSWSGGISRFWIWSCADQICRLSDCTSEKMNVSSWVVVLSTLAVCASVCVAFSGGPPVSPDVCNAMRPNPTTSPHGTVTAGDGDYRLDINPPMTEATDGFSFTADTPYTIRLVGTTVAATINGFLVQARVPGDTPTLGQTPMLLGSFQTVSGQQNRDCDGAGVADQATITHSQNLRGVPSVQFNWMSPSTAGVVDFYYTVLRAIRTHYDAIRAREVGLLAGTLPPTQPRTTPPPGNTDAPQRSPDDYRLQVLSPDGCSRSSCDLFIGIDTNTGDSGFLDIYMEGTAEGWVAVGFSATPNMFDADVVACNEAEGDITALDAWVPGARAASTDITQDVSLYSASFDDERINCTVSKRIAPSGSGEDLDLANSLYVIWARRVPESSMANVLMTHISPGTGNTQGVSGRQYRVTVDSGVVSESVFATVHRPNLIRAHGILMIIAWPLLAITGIFFATFMRPALPNGEWFQVHRAFMLASLFIALVSFVLIFVAHLNTRGLGSSVSHMVIGIIVTALQIINPIIAIFRCKPNDNRRWIFNMFHGTIGAISEGLAFANVAIGLSIFSRMLSRTFGTSLAPLWVTVAYDVFYVVFIIAGFVGFSVYACVTRQSQCAAPSMVSTMIKTEKKSVAVEMSSPGEEAKPEKEETPKRKPPSKDAPLRWGFLAVYLVVTVPIMIAVIVMVALP